MAKPGTSLLNHIKALVQFLLGVEIRSRGTTATAQDSPFRRGSMHLLMLVLLAVILSLVIHFSHQLIQSAHLEARRAALVEEVARLEAETDYLQGAVDYVESDVYVELTAREQLGHAREGDMVLVVQFSTPTPPPAPPAEGAAPPPSPLRPPDPNWLLWWKALRP
jgi:cell division protein FtsB